MSNFDFWDHALNAVGHLMNASQQRAAEQEAERAEASQRRSKQRATPRVRASDVKSFAEPIDSGPDCCVTKRKVKL